MENKSTTHSPIFIAMGLGMFCSLTGQAWLVDVAWQADILLLVIFLLIWLARLARAITHPYDKPGEFGLWMSFIEEIDTGVCSWIQIPSSFRPGWLRWIGVFSTSATIAYFCAGIFSARLPF